MRARVAALPVWFVLAALPLPAQTTWVVDANNGPGTHFTDLPPAVAAAAVGDELFIRTGGYSATTVSKGLVLRSLPGVLVYCHLTVRGLPRGQALILRGLSLIGWLDLQQCAGAIHMEGVVLQEWARGVDCDHITLVDFLLAGNWQPHSFTRCQLTMIDGEVWTRWAWLQPTTALSMDASILRAVRTEFLGHSGSTVCTPGCGGSPSVTAVVSTASSFVVGNGCRITGNHHTSTWYSGGGPPIHYSGCVGPSLQGTQGTLLLDPRATITCPSNLPTQTRVIADVTCPTLIRGTTVTVELQGEAMRPAALFAALPLERWVPTLWGEVLLHPGSLSTMAVGVTDGFGRLRATLPVSPHLRLGSLVVFQGFVVDWYGRLHTSLAAQRAVFDP